MSHFALQVNRVAKRYRIGLEDEKHDTLAGAIGAWVKKPVHQFRRLRRLSRFDEPEGAEDIIWALREVSFNVRPGEVVGIIGNNGAGKSTLLKILSRITEPSAGYVTLRGRVASLLEVGTGFHPELTGRENTYLNGTILGMTKAEIDRKFEEIVDFSGVVKFIDTPIKRYSSGMKVRLAFSVAAHLEPEIMLIDEVLAVGDAAFQRKCLGKMREVSGAGRTVLFVSHNMISVQNLCERVIWLEDGQIKMEGEPEKVVNSYLNETTKSEISTEQVWHEQDAPGNDRVRLHRVRIVPHNGVSADDINVATPFSIEFEYSLLHDENDLTVGLAILNDEGGVVFSGGGKMNQEPTVRHVEKGHYCSSCDIPGNLMNDGVYKVKFRAVSNARVIYKLEDAIVFEIRDDPTTRDGWYGKWPGAVRPKLQWNTARLEHVPSKIPSLKS